MSTARRITQGAVRLRQRIRLAGYTEQQASAVLGVSPQQVSNYLTGRSRPGLDMAFAIQDRFRVPVRAWTAPAA
jgi:transcriptional regulator with XRE-family HTH domain